MAIGISSVSFGGATRKVKVDKVYTLDDGGIMINGKKLVKGSVITPEQKRILEGVFDEVEVKDGKFQTAYNLTDREMPSRYSDVVAGKKAKKEASREKAVQKLQQKETASREVRESARKALEEQRIRENGGHVAVIKSRYAKDADFSALAKDKRGGVTSYSTPTVSEYNKMVGKDKLQAGQTVENITRKLPSYEAELKEVNKIKGKRARAEAKKALDTKFTQMRKSGFVSAEEVRGRGLVSAYNIHGVSAEESAKVFEENLKDIGVKGYKKSMQKNEAYDSIDRVKPMQKREKLRQKRWKAGEAARKKHFAELKARIAVRAEMAKKAAAEKAAKEAAAAAVPQKPAAPIVENLKQTAETVQKTVSETAKKVSGEVKSAAKKVAETAKDSKGTPIGKIVGISAAVVAVLAGIYALCRRSNKNSEAYTQLQQTQQA